MREFCDDREKLRKKGRNLKQIDTQISALQKNINKRKGEGEDSPLVSLYYCFLDMSGYASTGPEWQLNG